MKRRNGNNLQCGEQPYNILPAFELPTLSVTSEENGRHGVMLHCMIFDQNRMTVEVYH